MEETNTNPDPTPFKDAISGYKPLELVRALQDVQRLREDNSKLKLDLIALKEDPKLRANIELTEALREVDRLTSENVMLVDELEHYQKDNKYLNKKLDDYADEIIRLTEAIQKYTDGQE